jgi:hypothetical protein
VIAYAFCITLFCSVAKSSLVVPLCAISSLAIRGSATVNWSRNCQRANLYCAVAERVAAVTLSVDWDHSRWGSRSDWKFLQGPSQAANWRHSLSRNTYYNSLFCNLVKDAVTNSAHVVSNDWIIMNNEFEMWKEALVACFKALSRNLLRGTEESNKSMIRWRFEPCTSRLEVRILTVWATLLDFQAFNKTSCILRVENWREDLAWESLE